MRNPLLDRHRDRTQSKGYRRAPKQEKKVARDTGGYRVRGSGSGKEKGDTRDRGISRIECKCTSNKSIAVTRDMVEKITNAALGNGEIPAIHIEFLDKLGHVESEIAVIPYNSLLELLWRAKENDNKK